MRTEYNRQGFCFFNLSTNLKYFAMSNKLLTQNHKLQKCINEVQKYGKHSVNIAKTDTWPYIVPI